MAVLSWSRWGRKTVKEGIYWTHYLDHDTGDVLKTIRMNAMLQKQMKNMDF